MKWNIPLTALTDEQKQVFYKETDERTRKYFWMAACFVLLYQIYNICYTLHYTNFRLGTKASRVYMCLYVSIALACTVCLCLYALWKRKSNIAYTRMLNLYTAFGCILLLWAVCLTLYDQRVSDNLSIYVTTAIYVGGLFYINPRLSVPFYVICQVLLTSGFLWFHLILDHDSYGKLVNSVGITLIAIFLSLLRFRTLRYEFLSRIALDEKNKEILLQTEKLNYIANHDALTGVFNRNHLNEWISRLFQSVEERTVAIFMIDIDCFKQYNDTFGHVAGDECLRTVAQTLDGLEPDGLLFRFGGEEFLYLLAPPAPESGAAAHFANSLCQCVEARKIPAPVSGKYVTVSVGYSQKKIRNENAFWALINEADEALYLAKTAGRNCAVSFGAKDGITE